mmetsp:Transcript_18019/g.53378  ORF Transcript_18019/g.53378 Transcript_18019/m.53378 type:complete len:267 (+) Transcript_18019:2-802(+)
MHTSTLQLWAGACVYSALGLTVEYLDICFAGGRVHVKVLQLATLARSLHHSVPRALQLERHVPLVGREGWEEEHGARSVIHRREQHIVDRGPHERKMVQRRLIVLIVCREATESKAGGRRGSRPGSHLAGRLVSEIEHGSKDDILAPAVIAWVRPMGVCSLRNVQVGLARPVNTERMDRVELCIFGVVWPRRVRLGWLDHAVGNGHWRQRLEVIRPRLDLRWRCHTRRQRNKSGEHGAEPRKVGTWVRGAVGPRGRIRALPCLECL